MLLFFLSFLSLYEHQVASRRLTKWCHLLESPRKGPRRAYKLSKDIKVYPCSPFPLSGALKAFKSIVVFLKNIKIVARGLTPSMSPRNFPPPPPLNENHSHLKMYGIVQSIPCHGMVPPRVYKHAL